MSIPRLNPWSAAPGALRAMQALESHVQSCGLERSLVHLVKTRASMINGCAFCVHMHTTEARTDGETETRLYLLSSWEESSLFTPRERAALAWTEALTRLADTHAPDEAYDSAQAHFSPEELSELTLMIGTINIWNRFGVGFRLPHPSDRPT